METYHPPEAVEKNLNDSELPEKEVISEKWVREKLDSLIPLIREKWPTIAQQTLEATKGGIDDLVGVIANQTGSSANGIKNQLFELIDSIQDNSWEQISDKIEPIESQLEELLISWLIVLYLLEYYVLIQIKTKIEKVLFYVMLYLKTIKNPHMN